MKSKSKTEGKDIWSLFTEEQLAAAIARLGDRVQELGDERWRLDDSTKLPTSLWAQVLQELNVNNFENIRRCLYAAWRYNRRNIKILVENELKKLNTLEDGAVHSDIIGTEEVSLSKREIPKLDSNPSLPLPQPPNTRNNKIANADAEKQNSIINDVSFVLTPVEWKAVFSHTRQETRDGWTKILSEKLTSFGIGCSVSFRAAHIKQGQRKHKCAFFWCLVRCTGKECERTYRLILQDEPNENTSALFLVRIFGKENHNIKGGAFARQLSGEERFLVGKMLWYFLQSYANMKYSFQDNEQMKLVL
jgi:hypothetical protein